jgi:hypothetical protein
MILLIRLPIILVLTLLQFAAPLIHAHTFNNGYFESSIHLPEFEQVNSLRQSSPTFSNAIVQNDNTVVMSIGIKNDDQKTKIINKDSVLYFILLVVIVINRRVLMRCVLSQTEPITSPLFLTIFAPRAPPALV